MNDRPAESSSEIKFEIGHVLFIDIVGYSKGLISEQSESLQKLKEIVRGTEQFRAAEAEGKLLRLPTGDGGALVFRNSPEGPVLCAMEIAKALKNHPDLRVRMGIHSGPVNEISDLNEQANIAGAGINIAQRVMDCGDAGHILLSRHVAEDLEHYPRWQAQLHELGECEVKHGVRVSVVNLYNDDVGNPAVPERFRKTPPAPLPAPSTFLRPTKPSPPLVLGIICLAALAILAVLFVPRFFRARDKAGTTPISAGEHPGTSIATKSIAVLPFENLSSDKENAYFADGIQDEILTRLSKIAALKVISRTSTQKYKSTPDNLRDVGKQLGAANLVEGSVQKIANAVHVNVQLIRAATDEHLWAESYNRKLDDVFGVEGEVATAIAEQLNTKLSGAEEKVIKDKPTENTAAYDAYLRGLVIEQSRTDDAGQDAAVSSYATAVRLDPNFALAWAHLALIRSNFYFFGGNPAENSAAAVKDAADRAISLQPELGEAFIAQGAYRYRVLRDFQGALDSYGEAVKRLPNSSLALENMALVERRLGRWDIAEKHFRAAVDLDPRNVDSLTNLAQFLPIIRKFSEAQDACDRVLQIVPNDEVTLASKAGLYQQEGRLTEAARELKKTSAHSLNVGVDIAKALQFFYERRFEEALATLKSSAAPGILTDARTLIFIGLCQQYLGRSDEARETVNRAIKTIQPTPGAAIPVDSRVLRSYLALGYAVLGEKEKALAEAQASVNDYHNDLVSRPSAETWLADTQAHVGDVDSAIAALPHLLEVPGGITLGDLRVSPFWDPLRKDPRFQKLVGQTETK